MWKASQFNVIKEINGKMMIWNSRTGALASLDDDTIKYLDNPSQSAIPNVTQSVLSQNGFIVESGRNEPEEIIRNACTSPKDAEGLYYVIAPTLACNYHCIYCFENDRTIHSSMTIKTADAVSRFIESAIKNRNYTKYLHINWFGGEPLLQPEIISRISNNLLQYCQKLGIDYRASIVTNGRYLDRNTAELLQALKVKRVQISFDGTEQIYCKRKNASIDDYRLTIENIVQAAEILPGIVIRINISHSFFTDAYALTNYLLKEYHLDGKIKVYCANTYEGTKEERIKEYPSFALGEESFRDLFGTEYAKISYNVPRSRARRMTCGLVCEDRFCIGPEGELYKCEHDFGKTDRIVGNIFGDRNEKLLDEFRQANLKTLTRKECKECSVFPVCLGGCPNHTLHNEIPFDCKAYKNYLFNLAIRL